MEQSLIDRRECAMDRADIALDAAWPERIGVNYVQEMQWVAKELEEVASDMRKESCDSVEQSRTYNNLGNVFSYLAPALGHEMLLKAREAYLLAEALLTDCDDELLRAKLNFNFANTLRQIDPKNLEQLKEAERRFLYAKKIFSMQAPQFLQQVNIGLQTVESLIKLAPLVHAVDQNISDMEALEKEIKGGGDTSEIIKKAHEIMKRNGRIYGLITETLSLLNQLPPELQKSEKFFETREKMSSLTKLALKVGAMSNQEAQIIELQIDKLSGERAETKEAQLEKPLMDLMMEEEKILAYEDFEDLMMEEGKIHAYEAPLNFVSQPFITFQAYWHKYIKPDEWQTLLVYLCRGIEGIRDANKDKEWKSKAENQKYIFDSIRPKLFIPFGTQISILPELTGFRFNPPIGTIVFLENMHCVVFRMQTLPNLAMTSSEKINGRIAFFLGPLLICEILINVQIIKCNEEVKHIKELSDPINIEGMGRCPYRNIFVSYSHKESIIVDYMQSIYEAIGDTYFRDINILKSGEIWDERLIQKINESEIFQLCWSKRAKKSKNVEKEWRHALSLNRRNFIRPMYWKKPMPEPPEELSKIHFSYLEKLISK